MLYNDFMWNNFIQFQMFAGNLWTDPQYEKLVLSFEISQYRLRICSGAGSSGGKKDLEF